jgi:hypothetical protein
MNPADYLEKCGWQNDPVRFYAKPIDGKWKFTYTDATGPIGEYTMHYIMDVLRLRYKALSHTIRNAPLPAIIYDGMPKHKHTLIIWFQELPEELGRVFCAYDADKNIVVYDLDQFMAQMVAEHINGKYGYSPMVQFPSQWLTGYRLYWSE